MCSMAGPVVRLASGDFEWLGKMFKETQPEVVALGIQELHPDLLPKLLEDVQKAEAL